MVLIWKPELDDYVVKGKGKGKGKKGQGKGKGSDPSPAKDAKGKGKAGKGGKGGKGKGKGASNYAVGPFKDPATDWFKCQNCDLGWCFKGYTTPPCCNKCQGKWNFQVAHDYYGNPRKAAKPNASSSNEQKPNIASQRSAEEATPADDKSASILLEQLIAKGCDKESAVQFLEGNGLSIKPPPKPKVTFEATAIQLAKAENAVTAIDNLISQQGKKYQRIAEALQKSADIMTELSSKALHARLKVTQLKEARLDELKSEGISHTKTSAVKDFKTKLKHNRSEFETLQFQMTQQPPNDYAELLGWATKMSTLFNEVANRADELHECTSATNSESAEEDGMDEDFMDGDEAQIMEEGEQREREIAEQPVMDDSTIEDALPAANAESLIPQITESSTKEEIDQASLNYWQTMPEVSACRQFVSKRSRTRSPRAVGAQKSD